MADNLGNQARAYFVADQPFFALYLAQLTLNLLQFLLLLLQGFFVDDLGGAIFGAGLAQR